MRASDIPYSDFALGPPRYDSPWGPRVIVSDGKSSDLTTNRVECDALSIGYVIALQKRDRVGVGEKEHLTIGCA